MFTGLVEEVGHIRRIGRKGEAMVLNVGASLIMDDLKIGDSVAVNGVCLTATTLEGGGFTADVMPETYRHTNLDKLQSGSRVNLERAMQSGGRFGGHIVQGHVDGTGTIVRMTRDQNAVVFEIHPDDPELFKYLIPKGSVTLDGISLTVVQTMQTSFTVSIIPHTIGETVLNYKKTGDSMNIECDILGKYVDHLLQYGRGTQAPPSEKPQSISEQFLANHGFA